MLAGKGLFWMRLFFSLLLGIILSTGAVVFAQESPTGSAEFPEKGDLWLCPGAEIAKFSTSNMAYGGGLSLGYGRGVSIGLKAAYMVDADGMVTTLELNLLLRLYFLGSLFCSGPFIQLNAGPALFAQHENMSIPAEKGTISAGLSLGWRFLFGQYFFLEPAIRGGYPYMIGTGLSFGVHF